MSAFLSAPSPRLDRRSEVTARALYGLATALGLAAVGLAVWGWSASRHFDDQLTRMARSQSELLAREFMEKVKTSSDRAHSVVFEALLATPPSAWDAGVPRRVLDGVRQLEACRCAPAIAATGGAFWWSSARPDRFVTAGMDSTRIELMRQAVARVAPDPSHDGTTVVILKADPAGTEIAAPVLYVMRAGVVQAAGYVADPDQHAAVVMAPVIREVSTLRYGEAGDRIAGWRVIRPGGDTTVRAGTFDASRPALRVAFMRASFNTDSGSGSMSFVAPAGDWRARATDPGTPTRRNPRANPYEVLVQANPVALGEFLYGTGRTPVAPLAILLGVTLALTTATLALARRFVRHVREREAFATAVAHDLRTPLTQILLYGESLQLDRPAVRSREEAARIIVRETRRLIHLVENALHFVRGGHATPTLRMAAVDLAELTREVVVTMQPVLDRSGVDIALHLEHGVVATADRDAVTQILTNLVDNAVRFGPRGQTLVLKLSRQGPRAVLQLDDEGPGIPAAQREEVFRPFVRTGPSQGTGIGLAVSRQLADIMDGTLAAADPGGRGARLILTLPLAAAIASEPVPQHQGTS